MADKQETWEKLMGFDDLPDYGELIPLDEFQSSCKHHFFIDYDGSGYYATTSGMDRSHTVHPSNVYEGEQAPDWATHIVWFNR